MPDSLSLLRIVLLLLAGFGLWRLWRATTRYSPIITTIIAGAFLVRALAGQALFWISWLELPFARSLQLGGGFWFFGIDGMSYLRQARLAAADGLLAILTMHPSEPSVFFTKVLALFVWLFGEVASVGLLLNLFAFIGTALLVVACARRFQLSTFATAIPLVAFGYLPSWILWSLQPLKDVFFCFLVILFAFAVDSWIRAWRADERRAWRVIGAAALLLATIYAIAGIRWYYALVALGVAAIPLATILFARLPARQIVLRFVAMLLLGIAMSQLVVEGSGPYMPDKLLVYLRPTRTVPPRVITAVGAVVEGSRKNLDGYTQAGTRIGAGKVVRRAEKTVAPAEGEGAIAETAVVDVPKTPRGRLIAGFAALLLPHTIAEGLGLISVEGGRGLWWVADTDTVLFDLFLLLSLFTLFVRRSAWRDPFVWYLLVMSVVMAGALAYTISNFGALFRHREMVLASIALLPLAALRWRKAQPAAELRVAERPGGVPVASSR